MEVGAICVEERAHFHGALAQVPRHGRVKHRRPLQLDARLSAPHLCMQVCVCVCVCVFVCVRERER